MNKTKRALTSMIVISAVFCITLLFNIQLPLKASEDNSADSLDTIGTGAETAAEDTQDAVIHSFSIDQAKIFSVDQYLASSETMLAKEADTGNNNPSDPSGNQAPVSAAPTTAATPSPEVTEAAVKDQGAGDSQTEQGNDGTSKTDNEDKADQDTLITPAPEEPKEEQPEAKYGDIGISVAKEYVNIRKEPSTDGEILGKLYRDSACTILKTEGDWYYVESGCVTGYAKAEYIKAGLSDDELMKNYGTLSIIVDVDGLNVRNEPSEESKRLTVVYKNEKYPVLEQGGEWVKIHIEDENLDGYVKSEYTEVDIAFKEAVSKEEEEKLLQLKAEERAKKETEVKYGDGFSYTDEDLGLLACLIHAEAGTQSYEGKLAVANVVLNRVKSSKYPDTIKAVIYQNGQFSVAHSGSLEKQLNNFDNYNSESQKLSIKAAKDALEGANNIGKRMYFHTYKAAAKKGYNDYENSVKIGDHLFW